MIPGDGGIYNAQGIGSYLIGLVQPFNAFLIQAEVAVGHYFLQIHQLQELGVFLFHGSLDGRTDELGHGGLITRDEQIGFVHLQAGLGVKHNVTQGLDAVGTSAERVVADEIVLPSFVVAIITEINITMY